MPPGGSPPLQSGGQNHRWPASGQGGYITPAAWGVPTASVQGAESKVAHKGAWWLHNPCRLGGSPPLQSRGQNQRWPTSGKGGYISPPALGVPTASEQGAESEVARKWARWLHNPCRLGGTCRFGAGGRIRGGPQVGKVATETLPPGRSPPLQSRAQNQKWPTSGQGGYISPAAWGVPTASQWGAESQVARKWARWLHNPCCLRGPHRFTVGGRSRGGPQVGKVAT